MKTLILFVTLLLTQIFAVNSAYAEDGMYLAAQASTCIAGEFREIRRTDSNDTVIITLTNRCTTPIDFQNSIVTWLSRRPINTNFTGTFTPLSNPDSIMKITSTLSGTYYLASISLHFPTTTGSNSLLPVGGFIKLRYNVRNAQQISGSIKVYIGSTSTPTGSIELKNISAKPANVAQTYGLVRVTMNGQKVSDVQVPWLTTKVVSNLVPGTYALSADSVTDTSGVVFQGTATPASLSVVSGKVSPATISYASTQQVGKVSIRSQALPPQLSGYSNVPAVVVKNTTSGSSTSVNVNWNTTATVSSLVNGATYSFSTPTIAYNNAQCTPTFTPATLVASSTTVPVTNLTYTCTESQQVNVGINVSGGPATLTSLNVTMTPSNTAAISKTITLSNGSGSGSVLLNSGVTYQVSAAGVSGYSTTFSPQPLIAAPNAVETITLKQQTGTPVSINGQLKVCGTKLCNEAGTPIQLKGMSTHGLQWYGWGKCITTASLDALVNNYKASVIRLSLYVQEGGYDTDPVGYTKQVNMLIDEATKRGIYVIVDWHQLDPGDPNYNLEKAKKYFTDIITAHPTNNNLIYEIANEPSGVSWATIKSYADKIIPVIRALDPRSVIIVGTRGWSSLGVSDGSTSQEIINNPVNFANIMYTFHFYAASHKDEYYNELDKASNSLPIFVTEWGTQTYTGDGNNDFTSSDRYVNLMANKKISWTNWNYSDDFRSGAIWKTGVCPNGPWTDASLKPAGTYVTGKIKN